MCLATNVSPVLTRKSHFLGCTTIVAGVDMLMERCYLVPHILAISVFEILHILVYLIVVLKNK
jgi:hypothetical protein